MSEMATSLLGKKAKVPKDRDSYGHRGTEYEVVGAAFCDGYMRLTLRDPHGKLSTWDERDVEIIMPRFT
ncbi:MAG: hypothetical protein ACEQSX_13915 [Baekduiaceae bacterium]